MVKWEFQSRRHDCKAHGMTTVRMYTSGVLLPSCLQVGNSIILEETPSISLTCSKNVLLPMPHVWASVRPNSVKRWTGWHPHKLWWKEFLFFFSFFNLFFLISWRLITLQYCSGFCHTLTWISLGYTCIPHPNPPSHLPLYPIPLGLPSAPGPSTCLLHPAWTGDLFHPR